MSLIILCTYLWIIFCYWNWFAFKGLRDLENFIDTVKRSHLPGWKVVNKASSPKCEPLSVPFLGAAEDVEQGAQGHPSSGHLLLSGCCGVIHTKACGRHTPQSPLQGGSGAVRGLLDAFFSKFIPATSAAGMVIFVVQWARLRKPVHRCLGFKGEF